MANSTLRVSGVYRIRNVVTGRIYIGAAKVVRARWHQHRFRLRRGIHGNRHLQADAWEYGLESFVCEIVELVADLSRLRETEGRHLDVLFKSGTPSSRYNICLDPHSRLGVANTLESKRRQSAATKGRPNPGLWLRNVVTASHLRMQQRLRDLGISSNNQKLTAEDLDRIDGLRAQGMTVREIAPLFSVNSSTISRAAKGTTHANTVRIRTKGK
jgi:group I intron endonuclease